MKIVYVPFYNQDMTEGRGPMVSVGFGFSSRIEANRYIDRQPGVQGREAKWSEKEYGDWKVEEYPIYNSIDDLPESRKARAIVSAKSKLTKEELEALGIK